MYVCAQLDKNGASSGHRYSKLSTTNLPPHSRISQDPQRSSQQSDSRSLLYTIPTGMPLRRTLRNDRVKNCLTLSNTAASEHSENRSSSGLATQTYIRQNHVIPNIAQIQHHPTFIGISCSLYISFIQANTQFVSASTMYAMQSNTNSSMPSAPLARSGSPPRCCKHLPGYSYCMYTLCKCMIVQRNSLCTSVSGCIYVVCTYQYLNPHCLTPPVCREPWRLCMQGSQQKVE